MTDALYEDVVLIHEKLYRGEAYRTPTFYLYLKFHDNFMIIMEKLKDVGDFMLFIEVKVSDTCFLFVKSDELIKLLAEYIRENRRGEFGK